MLNGSLVVSVSNSGFFLDTPFLILDRQVMAWVFPRYRLFVLWTYSVKDLAVAWCGPMVFDLIVVVMTLVKTIQIDRMSGRDRTLTHVLIRDGKSVL